MQWKNRYGVIKVISPIGVGIWSWVPTIWAVSSYGIDTYGYISGIGTLFFGIPLLVLLLAMAGNSSEHPRGWHLWFVWYPRLVDYPIFDKEGALIRYTNIPVLFVFVWRKEWVGGGNDPNWGHHYVCKHKYDALIDHCRPFETRFIPHYVRVSIERQTWRGIEERFIYVDVDRLPKGKTRSQAVDEYIPENCPEFYPYRVKEVAKEWVDLSGKVLIPETTIESKSAA